MRGFSGAFRDVACSRILNPQFEISSPERVCASPLDLNEIQSESCTAESLGNETLRYVLVVGLSEDVPIHVVCAWRGKSVAVITVYIPRPPKFSDPWTRSGGETE